MLGSKEKNVDEIIWTKTLPKRYIIVCFWMVIYKRFDNIVAYYKQNGDPKNINGIYWDGDQHLLDWNETLPNKKHKLLTQCIINILLHSIEFNRYIICLV